MESTAVHRTHGSRWLARARRPDRETRGERPWLAERSHHRLLLQPVQIRFLAMTLAEIQAMCSRLFWGDAHLNEIGFMDLDGGGRRHIPAQRTSHVSSMVSMQNSTDRSCTVLWFSDEVGPINISFSFAEHQMVEDKYLLETPLTSFWMSKRYHTHQLNTCGRKFEVDVEIMRWFYMWLHLKKTERQISCSLCFVICCGQPHCHLFGNKLVGMAIRTFHVVDGLQFMLTFWSFVRLNLKNANL